jgi:hypothetical protein
MSASEQPQLVANLSDQNIAVKAAIVSLRIAFDADYAMLFGMIHPMTYAM